MLPTHRIKPIKHRRIGGQATALLAAFVCLWMNLVGALRHTDCTLAPAAAGGVVARTVSHAKIRLHADGSPSIRATASQVAHCIACDWQVGSLAVLTPPPALASSVAAPVAVPLSSTGPVVQAVVSASSRAPPMA